MGYKDDITKQNGGLSVYLIEKLFFVQVKPMFYSNFIWYVIIRVHLSVSSRLRAQPELLTDCSSMYKYYINEHIFWYYHVILSNDYLYVYMSTSQRRVYSAWSLAHKILTKKNAFFPVNVKVPANQRFIYPDNSFIKVSLFFSPNQIFLKI